MWVRRCRRGGRHILRTYDSPLRAIVRQAWLAQGHDVSFQGIHPILTACHTPSDLQHTARRCAGAGRWRASEDCWMFVRVVVGCWGVTNGLFRMLEAFESCGSAAVGGLTPPHIKRGPLNLSMPPYICPRSRSGHFDGLHPSEGGMPSFCRECGGGGGGQGCVGRGRGGTPAPSRAPSLCPATASLTASASFNGSCNRQYNRPGPLWQSSSNRLPNRF